MADETFTKADLDKAIKEAVEKEVGGLKEKRDELLEELKQAKADLRKANGVKPEDLAALEDENARLRTDLSTAQKAAKEATTAREKAEGALKTEQSFTHKLVVENGLREQLVAAGVNHPAHQKAAIAMLANGVQVAADGDNRVAKVGDKGLADFVKEWAASDEGKAFVSAPVNGGGGAGGSRGGPTGGKTMTRSAFNSLDPSAQMEFSKEGGTLTDA